MLLRKHVVYYIVVYYLYTLYGHIFKVFEVRNTKQELTKYNEKSYLFSPTYIISTIIIDSPQYCRTFSERRFWLFGFLEVRQVGIEFYFFLIICKQDEVIKLTVFFFTFVTSLHLSESILMILYYFIPGAFRVVLFKFSPVLEVIIFVKICDYWNFVKLYNLLS